MDDTVKKTKKTILLIEDDFFIRDIYERTLTKAGYEIKSAVDGQEGLDKATQQKVDLILLDIMMPKITGIEVLKELKKEGSLNKETPVFLITNLGQESIIKEGFTIGAEGYFMKSQLTPDEFTNEIDHFFLQQKPLAQK